MQLTLMTLSPLHIGTGNMLEPFDYYIESQTVYVLNIDMCIEALLDDDPDNIKRFSKWVDETSNKIANANEEAKEARRSHNKNLYKDKNQLIASLRGEFNIVDFTRNILRKPKLADQFIKDPKFQRYHAFIPNRPRNVVQLKEMIKTNNEPYIPGSSIKGGIRTALAYKVICQLDESDSELFLTAQDRKENGINKILNKPHRALGRSTNLEISEENGINKILKELNEASNQVLNAIRTNDFVKKKEAFKNLSNRKRKYEKTIGQYVEKFVFGCEDKKGNLDDPKFDIMRLIRVSDTMTQNVSMLVAELKSFTKDERRRVFKPQPINITEFIDTDSKFSFSIEVNTQLIRLLLNRQNVKEWNGFDKKINRLFDINTVTINKMNDTELERHIISKILESIDVFGHAITEKEKKWLEKFNPQDRKVLDTFLKQIEAQNHSFKLGFGSGWFATTIGLAIGKNQYLKNILPGIIYTFNLDLIEKNDKLLRYPAKKQDQLKLLQRIPDGEAFPTSRRLIADQLLPSDYIGWVSLQEGGLDVKTEEKRSENI